jgi:hypothetical protein
MKSRQEAIDEARKALSVAVTDRAKLNAIIELLLVMTEPAPVPWSNEMVWNTSAQQDLQRGLG